MFQQCRHIQTNGYRCRQIALHERQFCYYHQNRQPRRRRSLIRTPPATQTYDYGAIPVQESGAPCPDSGTWVQQVLAPVELLFPEDTASIQINLYRIAVAQAENRIDTRTANSMTWNQQVCLINLARKPLLESVPAHVADTDAETETTHPDPSNPPTLISRPVHRVVVTPDGDEIAPPLEILEGNEAELIHHKGCPCLRCAEKYRNHPPEEHHTSCACGLCEEQESEQITEPSLQVTESAITLGAPSLAQPKVGGDAEQSTTEGAPYLAVSSPDVGNNVLVPRPRIARAASLLSGSTSRDPLNRPWSVAEYTFGDAIRRHEAQYAARAAAALAVGIEPPPYEPFTTGLIPPGHPDYEEDQQMQQHSREYWAAHFRKLIAERPDIQQYLEEEQAHESAANTDNWRTAAAD